MKFLKYIFIFVGLFFSTSPNASTAPKLHLVLDKGVVIIDTFPEKAPNTVERIIELAKSGFYDGLTFHRVISGFMAQGGDPNGNGTGGRKKILKLNLMI